jgi:hypothetical protein
MGDVFGGGKGGKSPPSSPDFNQAAQIQADSSRETTREQTYANRPDQYGPFSSTTWEVIPGTPGSPAGPASSYGDSGMSGDITGISLNPALGLGTGSPAPGGGGAQGSAVTQGTPDRWTKRVSLDPRLQAGADGLMGQIASGAGLDPAKERDRAIEAAYGQSTSRLDPRFAAAREAREAQLANEGFSRGDEGWRGEFGGGDRGVGSFNLTENDAYQQAMYGAQTGAGNIAFDQALASRLQPYQQLGAIQGLSSPQGFTSAQGAQPLQSLAAAMQGYGANLDSYNATQAQKNSKMNGAAGLGGAAIMASDERLKTDIVRFGMEAIPGVSWARWKWKDGSGDGFGVIAQDLEKVRPDLVIEIGGVKHVNYGGLR